MAKLRHQQTRGRRVMARGYYNVTTFHGYWWCNARRRWVPSGNPLPRGGSTHYGPVRSARAFRRRLREWSAYLPPGVEFVLVSRWRGYDVTGTTTTRRTV